MIKIDGKELIIKGTVLKKIMLPHGEEWYHYFNNPEKIINYLKEMKISADIFTFLDNIPYTNKRYNYLAEWVPIAAIHITSYDDWWKNQIKKSTRHAVNKAYKKGVEIKISEFNSELIEGIRNLYNENPMRQGKPFHHYGKDYAATKDTNIALIDKSDFVCAYYKNELIGYIKITYMDNYVDPMMILASIKHRDKSPMNAMIAKVVEICSIKNIPYFLYGYWSERGLGKFKINNGFNKIMLPRYYIPLTLKGKIALKLGFHKKLVDIIPKPIKNCGIKFRENYYKHKITS